MQPCRVLLVDDEFIILDGIASVIPWERHGTVLAGTAQNGIAALELMESVRPDILITDIRMPGMDGLELAERVSEAYPDVGIIMLTGFNEFEYAKSAMQHGVKHYLLKPCSSEDVTAALDEIVAAQRERDSGRRFLSRSSTTWRRRCRTRGSNSCASSSPTSGTESANGPAAARCSAFSRTSGASACCCSRRMAIRSTSSSSP